VKVAQVSGLGKVWGAYPPDVLDSDTATVGGGEAAMLMTSFGLADLNHDVTCYYPGDEAWYRGVRFRPLDRAYGEVVSGDYAAVVSWSDQDVLRLVPLGTRRVFSQQLNHMSRDPGFWKAIDVLVSPTSTHARYLLQWANDKAPRLVIMGGGADTIARGQPTKLSTRKHVVSYWSSPDRGLHHLLLCWSQILARVPDAELRIFYHLDRFRRDMRHFPWALWPEQSWTAKLLDQLMLTIRNVKVYGAVSRRVLAQHQAETKVWAYPCDPPHFTEGLGVSVGEALAAGCYAVARPADALEEAWGAAVEWVRAPVCNDDFRVRFADAVVTGLLANEAPRAEARAEILKQRTWKNASMALENAIT